MERHLLRSYLSAFSIAASFLFAGCYTQLAVQGENDNPPEVGAEEPPPPVYYPVFIPEPISPIIVVIPSSGSSGQTKESPPSQRTSGVRRAGNSNAVPNTSDGGARTTQTGRTPVGNSNVGEVQPSSPASSPRTEVVRSPSVPSIPPPTSVGSSSSGHDQTSGSNRSNGASRSGR